MKMFIVSLLVYSSAALSSEALSTQSLDDVFLKIEEKSQLYGRDKVLVVFDIDNTLITSKNDLGSDQWFSWQESLMKSPNCAPACVTTDFNQLLKIQELLMNFGETVPTEKDLSQNIKRLQSKRQPIILLTSRGPDWRYITERSLTLNGMDFSRTAVSGGSDAYYPPYVLNNYARYSLTSEDVKAANLKEAKNVTYKNGIYMTEGQNKGIMLKVFLNKFRTAFQSVVFIDDQVKHVERMQSILGKKLDLVTFRYGGVDEKVERFKTTTSQATRKWSKLLRALQDAGLSF
jgi:hypothetical protein